MLFLFFPQFIILIISIPLYENSEPNVDRKRYRIVSEKETALLFYPAIRSTKPQQNEPNLLWFTKRQICEDIINSNYIGIRLSYYPYYTEPSWFHREEAEDNPVDRIKVSMDLNGKEKEFDEWVFACPVRRRVSKEKTDFYISEEYKIVGDSDSSSVSGRFIFKRIVDAIYLEGLAEQTANALSYTNHDIEQMYLERRRNHDAKGKSPGISTHPLCSLKFHEKIRICTAVFSSAYFEKKSLKYFPQYINWVEGSCQKNIISFRTEEGKAEAAEKNYDEEQFMSCRSGDDVDNSRHFGYLLSQAYKPNEIFVFSTEIEDGIEKPSAIFLETLSTNVRFNINSY